MKICPKCGKEYGDTNTLCPSDGAVLEKTGDALLGQTLADKYRIEELINEGGMGAVYRGTHVLMDKTVAIKVLHPALAADDKIVARFSREAKAASRISHPHALNVTDFGESSDGVVFLVMEYLNGRTLKEMIREEAPLQLPRIVEIIRQVCGALDAAHAQGVIHRDLKSDNIMLIDVGNGSDWAKVLDFGIAKIQEPVGQDPALTSPNLIIGTPQYMSPEQCSQASEIDARSDIYSLGVILYEMLTGHVPFTGESPTAIMMKHLQEPPPSVMEERRDVPASVGRVVARAMAKKPEDRFQSAGELAENLALAAEPNAAAAAVPASTSTNAAERDTSRIIVPTDPNIGGRNTANDDYDETTMVSPKRSAAPVREEAVILTDVGPPPDRFNIWRIAIPAVAALLVVFAVVYALTRNSGESKANEQATPLQVDQNAQPVQSAPPATGQNEQGITAKLPTETGNPSANANASQPANQNKNADDPSLNENSNANANGNNNAGKKNDNANSDDDQEDATPTPTPRKQPTPKPSASQDADTSDEPPPAPTPKSKPQDKPLPKPTQPEVSPAQTGGPGISPLKR